MSATAEEDMREAEDGEIFLVNVVDRIKGWLDRFAAKRTIDLLAGQERLGVVGPLYEVGLYHGKYFAILVRAALRTNAKILGVDTFDYVPRADFVERFVASSALIIRGHPARWRRWESS